MTPGAGRPRNLDIIAKTINQTRKATNEAPAINDVLGTNPGKLKLITTTAITKSMMAKGNMKGSLQKKDKMNNQGRQDSCVGDSSKQRGNPPPLTRCVPLEAKQPQRGVKRHQHHLDSNQNCDYVAKQAMPQ